MSARARLAVSALLLLALPAAAQEPPREEVVRRGTQLRLAHERAVGLVAVEPAQGERPARARVSVSAGAYAYHALLAPGATLVVGGAALEVTGVDPKDGGALTLARRPADEEDAPLRAAPAPEAGRLRLPEQGIYRLPDGTVVGVGNVRADGKDGAACVTLTVYGPGYRERPTQGYDLHADAVVGALEGQVRPVRVHAVEPARDGAPAAVVLEVLPPR